jgi:4-oxalocrotonate tautomerase
MPIIQMNLMTGRTVEQKRRLVAAVAQAAATALDVSPNTVRILIHELGVEDFSVAGVTVGQKAELSAEANAATRSPSNA